MIFLKKLLFYYFIDLYHILNRSKSGPKKYITLYCLLIYGILIYIKFILYICMIDNTDTLLT